MVDCFKVEREGAEDFNPKFFGNKRLLWHGSRFTNYTGILSQGLRIAPPEAPHTGYVWGKGIYFGNKIEMSWSYGRPEMSNGVGIYILAEVALGDIMDANREWHKNCSTITETNINPGKNSTLNGIELDSKDFETILDNVSVPFV